MKKIVLVIVATVLFAIAKAQNVGIGTIAPHASAKLDISDTSKGILIPRLTLQQRNAIASPAKGLMIFVTTDSSFYFFDGNWKRMAVANEGWNITGNNSIGNANFIGTVNAQPLRFRVNNLPAGEISFVSNNTSFGFQSFTANTTGFSTTAIGSKALFSNTTGSGNTALGTEALFKNTTGSNNTAIGLVALKQNTNGNQNTSVGSSALNFNTTGSGNTALGNLALSSNLNGNNNVAVGLQSMFFNSSGSQNTVVGNIAMLSNTTGINNTAIGCLAMANNTTGSNNTAIGINAGVNTRNLSNTTAIGMNALVNASNKIRLGNTAITVIEGQVPFTTPSDGRFKTNIKENVSGLNFIMQLRPVTYNFKTADFDNFLNKNNNTKAGAIKINYTESENILHTGFIAQEVELAANKAGFKFDGLIVPKNENETYSLSYSQFVVPLVKALQEQQLIIEKLTKQVEAASAAEIPTIVGKQQKTMEEQQKKIERLEKIVEAIKK